MFCPKCGAQNDDAVKFCSGCGQPLSQSQPSPGEYSYEQDVQENKAIAIISYFLFFIPLLTSKRSKFARFHANQSLSLVICSFGGSILLWIVSLIFGALALIGLWVLLPLLGLLYLALWLAVVALLIIGIVNAANGKMQPLPVIGTLFNIIK